MLEFLGHEHELPCGPKDRIITLFLPEGDIKFPIREIALHEPGSPGVVLIVVHDGRPFPAKQTRSIVNILGRAGNVKIPADDDKKGQSSSLWPFWELGGADGARTRV